jgi:hypothetical protein
MDFIFGSSSSSVGCFVVAFSGPARGDAVRSGRPIKVAVLRAGQGKRYKGSRAADLASVGHDGNADLTATFVIMLRVCCVAGDRVVDLLEIGKYACPSLRYR